MKTYWQAFKRMLKKEKDMIMSIKDMKINYSDIKMKYTTVFREIRQHYGLSWAIWIMWSTLIFEGIKGLILGSYLTPIPGLGPIAAGAHVIVALDRLYDAYCEPKKLPGIRMEFFLLTFGILLIRIEVH